MTWRQREGIADTSVLLYLHLAHQLQLLQVLFRSVTVPAGVVKELRAGATCGIDVPSVESMGWLATETAAPTSTASVPLRLGLGEREVIALALERPGAIALLDDRAARTAARSLGLSITGTLGVLLRAKQLGAVDQVAAVIERIIAAGFRVDRATHAAALRLAGEDH
ncbi:MAG: DUF3368 domain-containing protein [Polyangiaceae bacterium]|nr:DUF3368 domain-containing protein [Polyangiaceae bacterium]